MVWEYNVLKSMVLVWFGEGRIMKTLVFAWFGRGLSREFARFPSQGLLYSYRVIVF